jgi:hypothetical protein
MVVTVFQVLPMTFAWREDNHENPQFIIVSDLPEIVAGNLPNINKKSINWFIVSY